MCNFSYKILVFYVYLELLFSDMFVAFYMLLNNRYPTASASHSVTVFKIFYRHGISAPLFNRFTRQEYYYTSYNFPDIHLSKSELPRTEKM